MISLSTSQLFVGLIAIIFLAIVWWLVARTAGDRSANRLQELLECIEQALESCSAQHVRRKFGTYRLFIIGPSIEIPCTYHPRQREMRYIDGGLDVRQTIRHGHEQDDVNHLFGSLNISQAPATAAEKLAQLDFDRNLEFDQGSREPAPQATASSESEVFQADIAVDPALEPRP